MNARDAYCLLYSRKDGLKARKPSQMWNSRSNQKLLGNRRIATPRLSDVILITRA